MPGYYGRAPRGYAQDDRIGYRRPLKYDSRSRYSSSYRSYRPYESAYKRSSNSSYRRPFRKGYDYSGGYYGKFRSGKSALHKGGPIEKKFHQVAVADTAITTVGAVYTSLNIIAQGTTQSTRIGRKVTVKKVQFHGYIYLPVNTNPNLMHEQVRMIWFIDKQANGAMPAVTQILDTDDVDSFYNLANIDRFVIVKDKVYSLQSPSHSVLAGPVYATGETSIYIKMNKKCNVDIYWDSTTGAITECRSNNFGLMTVSRSGTATSTVFHGIFRMRYTDA